VSPQSRPVESVEALRACQRALEERLKGADVPRPANWGGYLLRVRAVELWIAGADRLHDRTRYERQANQWAAERLAP
jgi:pyridoxamine 5'-phosphate oxidase